ncbi:MAG: hypothetical protein IKG58_00655 [Bacilli bacterium]|nr:hypothetical protein [Bacilli bacterium]
MSKNKKVIIILFSLIFLCLILAGFFLVNSVVEGGAFRSEMKNLELLDVVKDRFNTRIKSTKDYAIVEKRIKDYLDDCSITYSSIINILNSKKLNKMLSVDNYKKDGPNFKNSLKYIEKLENKYDKLNKKFSESNKEDNILDNIEKEKLDDYYISIYKDNMIDGKLKKNLDKSINNSKTSRQKVKNKISNIKEVITILKNNKDKWNIKKNKISFDDYKLYEKYNELVKKIKKK